MLFNSFDFAVFLPVVFIFYWYVFNKSIRIQNSFLVLISYFFYGWWDAKFLVLIFLSTVVDFYVSNQIWKEKTQKKRRLLLGLSLISNLGILGFFKYSNFFIESFVSSFTFPNFSSFSGLNFNAWRIW